MMIAAAAAHIMYLASLSELLSSAIALFFPLNLRKSYEYDKNYSACAANWHKLNLPLHQKQK
jgi:hypothetical protein